MVGLKPYEIYSLELWEFNSYLQSYAEQQKAKVFSCILTAYYTAYYVNGGKKVKSPEEIMDKTFSPKQTVEDGMAQIMKLKQLEKINKKEGKN